MRGNLLIQPLYIFRDRSIPACAGEPIRYTVCISPAAVYPRVCGGTSGSRGSANRWAGLSPRVRGNPIGTANQPCGAGSIPACAGEPTPAGAAGVRGWVYPRVCGGTILDEVDWVEYTGLSPRVRGNP